MSATDPSATSVSDICTAALKEAGVVGTGQTASADNITDAWARLQWMLQEWQRKRWLQFHIKDYSITSTGATTYSVGPGGDLDTGVGTMRPDKIEYAFLRQLTQSQPNQIDYPLQLIMAKEDYARIALKELKSFPSWAFYEASWPLGTLYVWPVAQASIYAVHIGIKELLPTSFASTATQFAVPYEYYNALVYNLGLRLRSKFQIPTYPGDMLPGLAKDSLNALRKANAGIGTLVMPADLTRSGIYNIFSDRNY